MTAQVHQGWLFVCLGCFHSSVCVSALHSHTPVWGKRGTEVEGCSLRLMVHNEREQRPMVAASWFIYHLAMMKLLKRLSHTHVVMAFFSIKLKVGLFCSIPGAYLDKSVVLCACRTCINKLKHLHSIQLYIWQCVGQLYLEFFNIWLICVCDACWLSRSQMFSEMDIPCTLSWKHPMIIESNWCYSHLHNISSNPTYYS